MSFRLVRKSLRRCTRQCVGEMLWRFDSFSYRSLSAVHDRSTMPRRLPQRSRRTTGLRVVSTSLAMFAGLAVLTATPAVAAPFTNGSFESPAVATFQSLTAANAPAGWPVPSDPRGFTWNAPAMWSRGYPDMRASDGGQFVSLQYTERLGTLSQTFDTQPGRTYRVEFDLSAMTQVVEGVNLPQTFTLTATAPGVSQDFSITTLGLLFGGSNQAGTDPWIRHGFDFVADGMSSTLTFLNRTNYGDASLLFGTSLASGWYRRSSRSTRWKRGLAACPVMLTPTCVGR